MSVDELAARTMRLMIVLDSIRALDEKLREPLAARESFRQAFYKEKESLERAWEELKGEKVCMEME